MNTRTPLARGLAIAAAVAIIALAAVTLAPLWLPLAFAAWTASLMDKTAGAITKRLRNHRSIGAFIATSLVATLLVPVVIALTSMTLSVVAFVRQVMASPQTRAMFEAFVAPDSGAAASAVTVGQGSLSAVLRANMSRLPELARQHGATAWDAASRFAGAGAIALLLLFVYFVALYAFLDTGRAMWTWTKTHAPFEEATCERLAKAFLETGRGLIVGAGLTALAQAILATIIYAVMGVPRFGVLGALTFICSFVPAVGTAVVWGPVAVGLALKGHVIKAVVLAALGTVGISSIDNVLRPLMQRWGGNLQLPAFVLLLAAFGGLEAFGAKGLVLGPLAVRLAAEVLAIEREQRALALSKEPDAATAKGEPDDDNDRT